MWLLTTTHLVLMVWLASHSFLSSEAVRLLGWTVLPLLVRREGGGWGGLQMGRNGD